MNSHYLLVSVLLLSLFGSGAPQTQPRIDPRAASRDSNRQELDRLLLRKPILTIEDKGARQALLKQVNEDFRAIQVLNNNLMRAIKDESATVDLKLVANTLTQLGSKASRLQDSLLLPETDQPNEPQAFKELETVQQFKQALVEFDTVVARFATNPIFQEKNVVDIELGKKASRDLEIIVKQSRRLKKAATKLGK